MWFPSLEPQQTSVCHFSISQIQKPSKIIDYLQTKTESGRNKEIMTAKSHGVCMQGKIGLTI